MLSTATSPTKCLACEGALDGSIEHAFPQALGGTKKSRSLYCETCNKRLGREVDAPFTKDFEFATTALNVQRDRGPPPTLKVTTSDGGSMYLKPGGVAAPGGPSPTVIERRDGNRAHVTITVPADRPELHEHMLAKAAKELGVSPDAFGEGSMVLKTSSAGTVNALFALGGPMQLRAAAKIALSFLALEIGDDVFSEAYALVRSAVVHGGDVRAWRQPPFRHSVAPTLPMTDRVQHRVLIYIAGNETWAHVEVYGIIAYAVLLADAADARFASPYVWGQNPTTGVSGEGHEPKAEMPTPIRVHASTDSKDFVELGRAMQEVAVSTALERTISEEVAIAFTALGEDEEISESFIDELSRRVAERLIALRSPGSALNISRPIANRDELERIRRALRGLDKPRK